MALEVGRADVMSRTTSCAFVGGGGPYRDLDGLLEAEYFGAGLVGLNAARRSMQEAAVAVCSEAATLSRRAEEWS